MKNKILIFLITFFFLSPSLADNLNIKSENISIDKEKKLSIFKDNVVVTDVKNNVFKTNYAEYLKDSQYLKSVGETTIETSEGYFLKGEDVIFDGRNEIIKSEKNAVLTDLENNMIYLDNFEYSTKNNFFKSFGNIKILDSRNNSYNFSQLYIDEKKREIVGSDIKAYLNDKSFKINKNNKPRIFANTVKVSDKIDTYNKSIFTLCDYRKNDKCPPWTILASEMLHNKENKTIYYENALIKFYKIPIFYVPRLSHPDPSVDRRSGFLPPTFLNTKNLGSAVEIPYYWAINKDKDITFKNKFFVSENPLLMAEYRHAFQKSNLVLDFGYTEGYKKTSKTKTARSKSHIFGKFIKNFKSSNGASNSLEVSLQDVSNDKYLKLYKVNSDLVDYNTSSLENIIEFIHQDEDLFLGAKASVQESLKETYNDKYEYILPDIVLNKPLFNSDRYGYSELETNLKVHNYDTNKSSTFFVNNIDWESRNMNFQSGVYGKFLGQVKNVNYEAENISYYKDETTNEVFGALGFLSKIDFFKRSKNETDHLLTPKVLLRYAPGHMRKQEIDDGARLDPANAFDLDRLNSFNNFEKGMSASLGFDYQINGLGKEFNFSVGQIINSEENKEMPSSSSLNQKISDLVGSAYLNLNENITLKYDFAVDQNYNEVNYNEVGAKFDYDFAKFDMHYLTEKKHIGTQEYIRTNVELLKGKNGLFSFGTKRNLVSDSAEYYNLSYEYLNDCIRAGIVYRREFYTDSEIEADHSLLFKVTLTPFGDIELPQLTQ
tara:strand:+ start:13239 stop:15557 length:2319 start_codon:yes stop_codon:yes gene_type:complete